MAAAIKTTFAQCKKEDRPALVGYFTAGYPTKEECPDIMLGLQAGGVGKEAAQKPMSSWVVR
jgi:tryptophan synthase